MTTNVVLIAHHDYSLKEGEELLSQIDDLTIIHSGKDSEAAIEVISNNPPTMIIIVDKPKDDLLSHFILKVMKIRLTPCLILLSSQENISKYRAYINIPLIDILEINKADSFFIKLLSIRINILRKLKLDKFKNQLGKITAQLNHRSIIEGKKEDGSNDHDDDFTYQVIESEGKTFRRKKLKPPDPNIDIIESETAAKIDYSKIIVIGASTGGPGAVTEVLNGLPSVFPPVLIVQHMPKGFIETFVQRLNHFCRLPIKVAKDGDRITRNTVYVAQGERHLELEQVGTNLVKIRITDGPLVNFVKPAVDVTLFSAARIYGKKTISVILTGMGYDGREGSRTVKKVGGTVIAQDEESCVVYGMNKGVIESNLADQILDISKISKQLIQEVIKNSSGQD